MSKLCNLSLYLQHEELECLRIGRTYDEGSQGRDEWLLTAKVLQQRQVEHLKTCEKCLKQV